MCILYMTVAFYGRFLPFAPNLVRIGPIVEKWQHIFEIKDGGGSHLEKYTSGWTASMRKELLVRNFFSKIYFSWGYLDVWGNFTLEGSNGEAITLQIGSPKTGRNFDVFWAGNPLKWIWRLQTPKRHVHETEHVVWANKRANRSGIATCRQDEETEK